MEVFHHSVNRSYLHDDSNLLVEDRGEMGKNKKGQIFQCVQLFISTEYRIFVWVQVVYKKKCLLIILLQLNQCQGDYNCVQYLYLHYC